MKNEDEEGIVVLSTKKEETSFRHYCNLYSSESRRNRYVQFINDESNQGEHISPEIIEKLVRDFKTHRCALDFENKFIVKID